MGLFSSKVSHPLADAKEVRRVLEEVAKHEPAAALEETIAWMDSLSSAADLKLEMLLDLLLRLDEAALPQANRLARDYLMAPRLSRSQEYHLWRCNSSYWQQLVTSYENCCYRYASGDKAERKSIEGSLALLYARLLRSYVTILKWTQFRYGPFDRNLWHGAGRIFLAAVAAKMDRKRFAFYANAAESTIEQEYLKALILHSSSVSNLLPLEMEIAERFIAYLLPSFVFTDVSRPDSVYWVDINKPLPPTRLIQPPEITPTLRFLSPGQALEKLTEIRARIDKSGAVPQEINLGSPYAPNVVLPVLDHLALNWMPKPPMRNYSRHHVKSRLAVINGLEPIYARLANASKLDDTAEAWIAEDVSIGGMGAQVPLGVNEWIRIGALVGLQPEGGENWLIGVVRRFNRGSDGFGSVGIQTIGKWPRAVVADSGGLKTEVILLDTQQFGQTSALVEILLAGAAYEDGIPLKFTLDGKAMRLQAQGLVERGADYSIGRYRIEAIS
jgi:hypothetical protein